MKEMYKKIIAAVLLFVVAILSCTVVTDTVTSNKYTEETVSYLDERKKTVMEISAASTAASVAITMLPGDAGSPVADKLADVSTYTLIVLCAIFLEKYLVSITGLAAFKFLIPAACLICIADMFIFHNQKIRKMAASLFFMALLIFAVIPVSVQTSKMIEQTYQDSIQETIQSAQENSQEIQENAKDESLFSKFLSTVSGGVNDILKNFEGILNRFIEAIAVMIVTSAVIPIVVMLFFISLLKTLMRYFAEIPDFNKLLPQKIH
ncbi:MAG: hypothetical protein J6E46_10565 [Faecalicoccus sp.]|nr:hypothetical protein [Faecalicoccus sp.]